MYKAIKTIAVASILLGLALLPAAAQSTATSAAQSVSPSAPQSAAPSTTYSSATSAPPSLSLDEAIRAALARNLNIALADIELRSKTRSRDLSFNVFYPSLTVSGSLVQVNEVQTINYPVAASVDPVTQVIGTQVLVTPSATNLQLKATVQEVFSFTSFGLIDKAALDWQSARISRVQAERSIRAAVRKIYYQLLVQDEAVKLTQSRLNNAEERLRQAEFQHQLGTIGELVLQQARVNAIRIRPELDALRGGQINALVQFQTLLGYAEPRADLQLSDHLVPPPPAAIDWQSRESNRIDLQQSKLNISLLQTALRIQDLSLLPVVALQYSLDPTFNNPFAKDLTQAGSWHQNSGALSLSVSWNLANFLPGSGFWAQRAETADRLEQAQTAALQTQRTARDSVAATQRNIALAYQRIADLQAVAEGSKRIFELTEASYKAGAGRLLDLQDAELGWQNSRIQVLNEELALMAQLCDLEAAYLGD